MITKEHIQALVKKGHSKDTAFIVAQNESVTFDYLKTDIKSKIDNETGFLKVNGITARTGIQQYLGMELPSGFNLDAFKVYNVYRPSEEVVKKESLDSYTNAPITDDHPSEFVTIDNIKELGKGSISSVETFNKDGIDYIKTDIIVTDEDLIQKIQDGKAEISPGYSTSYKQEKGTFQGLDYDFIQTDIKINHIAIVEKGRCNGSCKITDSTNAIILDSTKSQGVQIMAKLKVGDAEFEVNDAVAAEFTTLQNSLKAKDEEIEASKEELSKKDEENGQAVGEKEALKQELEELKAKIESMDVHALANDRAVLLAQVSDKIGDADVSKMKDTEIKVLALSKVSDMDLKDKSDEYIAGMFDTMIKNKANDSLDEFGKAITKDDSKKVLARDAYIAKLQGEK